MDSVENMVYQVPEFTGENIPVIVAAKIMKKDQQFIRQGMIQEILDIGTVFKKEGSRHYDFYISLFKFWKLIGYVYRGKEDEAGTLTAKNRSYIIIM